MANSDKIQEHRTAERSWSASCSTLASWTQQTMIMNNRFRASHSVYNSRQHRRWDDGLLRWQQLWSDAKIQQEAVLVVAHSLCDIW